MYGIDQLLARKRMRPRLVFTPAGAHLGDNYQSSRIRMERLLDGLIGHMRTVVVAGIDVIHAGRHSVSQNGDGTVDITRWSPHLWTGKLHCAVAHPVQGHLGVQ